MAQQTDATPAAPGDRTGADGLDGPLLAAIEGSPVAMVLADPNHRDEPIVYANPAFLRLTGYGRSEVIGRNCRFLQGPGTDQAAVEEIRRAIRGRAEIATELLNYRKDGTPFWNALSISPVLDRSGAVIHLLASQMDVSRGRAEGWPGGAGQGSLGQAAHEFNNLLQIITGHMQGLRRHAARSGDDRLIRQVRAVSEAADRAVALVQRLCAPPGGVERPSAPAFPGEGGSAPAGRERVLVVDDRIEVADLARTMLEDAGYAVEVARDARDALARLDRGFDLLFTDLVMPGEFDGAALAREARRRRPGLGVLLTTGQADAASAETAPEFDTILKPYRRAELAKAVRAALDGATRR